MSFPATLVTKPSIRVPTIDWSSGEKIFIKYLLDFASRFPNTFDCDALQKARWMFMQLDEEFCTSHEVKGLVHLLLNLAHFQKALEYKWNHASHKRHLLVDVRQTLLQLPFGAKRVLGLLVGMNILKQNEMFTTTHLQRAVAKLVPSVRFNKTSSFSFTDSHGRFTFLYLEVEKAQGGYFTTEERDLLRRKLKQETKKSIEILIPSLFFLRNDEQLYKNLLFLSGELKQKEDLPELMIHFREQRETTLIFSVLIVRAILPKTPSLEVLRKKLSEGVDLSIDRVLLMGTLPDKTPKEGAVMVFTIDSHSFLRQDNAIDLVKARQYITKSLDSLLGPYRDCNGGLYEKQTEHLTQIKQLLDETEREEEVIDRLFFSLSPLHQQAILPVEATASLCKLFLKACTSVLSSKKPYILCKKEAAQGGFALVIKGELASLVEKLSDRLASFFSTKTSYAFSQLEVNEAHYFSLIVWGMYEGGEHQIIEEFEKIAKVWEAKQNKKQTLRVAISAVPGNLDPHTGVDRLCRTVQIALFEGLMRHSLEGTPIFAAASHLEISKQHTSYRFFLRKAVWSNSDPLTAYDFEWAWKKALLPTADSPRADLFYVIRNGKKFRQGLCSSDNVGVKALDDRILQVDLEHYAPYFLDLICRPCLFPLYRGTAMERGHVVNGPFKIAKWDIGHKIVLKKNPKYWDASHLSLDKIVIHPCADPNQMYKMYERDEIDWAGSPFRHLPLERIATLEKEKKLLIHKVRELYWLSLNTNQYPLNSSKIRQALSLVLNREELLKEASLFNLPAKTVTHHFIPEMQFPEITYFGDTAYAKELLEEGLGALRTTKSALPPLHFSYSDIPGQKELAILICKQWESKLGISVKLEGLKWFQFFKNLGARRFQIGGCLWEIPYNDPIGLLNLLRDTSSGLNISQWEDPNFVQILDTIDHTMDPIERLRLVEAAGQILIEQMPVIPLYAEQYKYVKNKKVKDLYVHPTGQVDFRFCSIDKKSDSK